MMSGPVIIYKVKYRRLIQPRTVFPALDKYPLMRYCINVSDSVQALRRIMLVVDLVLMSANVNGLLCVVNEATDNKNGKI